MALYRVFGGLLRSPLFFPELEPADEGEARRGVDWQLDMAEADTDAARAPLLGSEELANGAVARLYELPSRGYLLRFDDTGTFTVSPGGEQIAWFQPDARQLELGRVDFMGRVMALAAHARGQLCLHGSAVILPMGTAVGFLAPKGFGKSTIALELLGHGARLLTDDTLPVMPATGEAAPGVHSMRLNDDVLGRITDMGTARRSLGEKTIVEGLARPLLAQHRAPLSALYALAPVAEGHPVERQVLPLPAATLTLIQFAKLGPLLGGNEAPEVLDRAARVAARVRVARLMVPRDLARLPEAARHVLKWCAEDRGRGT